MKKNLSIIIFTIFATLIITACTPVPATQTDSSVTVATGEPITAVASTPLAEITPVTPTSAPDTGGQKIVTRDDQGKTIEVTVGENFLLQLGDGYIWEITISDESVITRAKNISVIKDAQGVYDVLQAGTATLTAVGEPGCRQSQPPCSIPTVLFTVTIVAK